MLINPWLFPGGKTAALTMSYDDGPIYDEPLIEIFNKYGIKGTFHVNNHSIGECGNFPTEKARELYKGHELSVHTASHPFLQQLPDAELMREVLDNKRKIEDVCGYTVRGMSYPFGDYNERVMRIMKQCGMNYSRTTVSTNNANLPENFLAWHPTCHHKGVAGKLDLIKDEKPRFRRPRCLYVWGHSYEFNNDQNWSLIEDFCKEASGIEHVWYATNIEIYDYTMAVRALEVSETQRSVFNPSYMSVWAEVNGEVVELKPGENSL